MNWKEHGNERIANFGLDLEKVKAFSLKGVWDHDSRSHLNVHPAHQVLTVRDGVLLLEDGKEKQPLYKHTAAFIPAFKPHRVRIFRDNIKIECNSLFVHPSYFRQDVQRIGVFEISELGAALLNKLNEVNLANLTEGLMGHCLSLFLEILANDMDRQAQLIRLPEAKNSCCRDVITFIEKNFMNKIRLSHLSKAVPLSARQISRIFQSKLSMSPFDYLRLYRLLRASVMLNERERKVINIAFDCGYQSISSFYKDFNLYYGIPPHQFRKKISR